MKAQENNLLLLEEQMTSIESDALEEERINAKTNYQKLEKEIDEVYIPHPEVLPSSTGMDYADISDIKWKKDDNKKGWEEQGRLREYLKNPKLHVGHLQSTNGWNYFFMESPLLESKVSILMAPQ